MSSSYNEIKIQKLKKFIQDIIPVFIPENSLESIRLVVQHKAAIFYDEVFAEGQLNVLSDGEINLIV